MMNHVQKGNHGTVRPRYVLKSSDFDFMASSSNRLSALASRILLDGGAKNTRIVRSVIVQTQMINISNVVYSIALPGNAEIHVKIHLKRRVACELKGHPVRSSGLVTVLKDQKRKKRN